MAVAISIFAGAGWQFFDNGGLPLSGGLIYTYSAGTNTPIATYTDSTGLIANSNPIQLDSSGRPPAEIWLTPGNAYKFVVKDSTSVLIRTYDNIPASAVLSIPLSIADGGTNNTSFQAPVGNVCPLIYFDGTKLTADQTPTDLGYDIVTDTFYINNLSSTGDISFTGTGAIKLPAGTTAQEPYPPAAGMIRFNITTNQFEGYNGTVWNQVGGGATGGGQDHIFVLNGQTVTVNYTIPSGMNASTVGIVTINAGVTVTIPTGSRWVIL
jgi:hypothetical protein